MSTRHDGSLALTLLGRFEAAHLGVSQDLKPSGQRLVALLATLGVQRRSDLAGHLWPDLSETRAAANLRTVLWRMKRVAGDFVVEQADGCSLGAGTVDLHTVRLWAKCAIRGDDRPVPNRVGQELLPGWDDDWLIESREELRLLQLHALEVTAQRFMADRRLAEASTYARTAVTMDPLRESANRILIEASIRQGNQVEALRQFRRFEKLLDEEIGVPPSPMTTQLMASLLAADTHHD